MDIPGTASTIVRWARYWVRPGVGSTFRSRAQQPPAIRSEKAGNQRSLVLDGRKIYTYMYICVCSLFFFSGVQSSRRKVEAGGVPAMFRSAVASSAVKTPFTCLTKNEKTRTCVSYSRPLFFLFFFSCFRNQIQ